MLEVRDLKKRYGERIILNEIDFSLQKGLCSLIGRNGSGKTTLLKCILGIENYEGSIKIDGREVRDMDRREIALYIGYVPQMSNSELPLTIKEFVEMGAYYRDGDVEEIVKKLNLEEERKINTLSGGEFQKVLIARALVGEPKILLLDEPASHLDIKNTLEIIRIIKNYSKSHLVIAVIHDLNLLSFSDGILALKNGKCEVYKKMEEVKFNDIFEADIRLVKINNHKFIVPKFEV